MHLHDDCSLHLTLFPFFPSSLDVTFNLRETVFLTKNKLHIVLLVIPIVSQSALSGIQRDWVETAEMQSASTKEMHCGESRLNPKLYDSLCLLYSSSSPPFFYSSNKSVWGPFQTGGLTTVKETGQ